MQETVAQVLDETVRRFGDRPAMRVKHGGQWQSRSWQAYSDEARRVARALIALGVRPGQGVAILGFNAPEWVLANVGAILAGAFPAGIYTTSSPEQCEYILGHSDAVVAIVDDRAQAEKIVARRRELPALRSIVQWRDEPTHEGVLRWSELLALGDPRHETELDARIAAQRPDDVCTLIYTSGTTGTPKAVMLSHHNCTWVAGVAGTLYGLGPDDFSVSYLPLSHVAEQILTIHAPMKFGGPTVFAESLETMASTLLEVRPSLFFGVPRVWEKIQEKIEAAAAQSPLLRRRIARAARAIGLRGHYAEQRGERKPLLYGVAERLVFSKVKTRLGLDRARLCMTGAAPIPRSTLEFFLSLGVPIFELYGMSECTGPVTASTPGRYRTGKAGVVLPGAEVRIADDGEILVRGPSVFKGYLKDPEATAQAIDAEGWLRTGDIGALDADGFLTVTDRKKEILITAGGENVSPQAVEGELLRIPVVSQAVVIGDRRKYLTALITLDPERVMSEARAAGSPARTAEEAATCTTLHAHLDKQIELVNRRLARVQTIKRFAILPNPLTIAAGELTPTMKLRRQVVIAKYTREIEDLYR
jgi:long-subunit acyl-CoA synthetase (AMP-forming)